jgi:type I restriction enzyme S subunit
MTEVLFSIHPNYVKKIISGEKEFEFRKRLLREKVTQAIIYATTPIRKIVATFDIGEIISGTPTEVWLECKEKSGIDYDSFMKYFKGKDKAYAYQITNLKVLKDPLDIKLLRPNFIPPQSFSYIDWKRLMLNNM